MPKMLARLGVAVKAAATNFRMSWNQGRTWRRWLSGGTSRFDYAAYVGDGRGNSIVMSCLGWMGRKFPDATIRVRRVKADGTKEVLATHPMMPLLRRPNDFYSASLMFVAVLADWMLHGNGYLRKQRSLADRVVRLWYIPQSMLEPVADSPESFIDYYRYTVGGQQERVNPRDIIHFRNGLDPVDPRLGLSPLGSLFREIFTDDEAANYSATVLRNLGVLGVLVSPKGDTSIPPDAAEQIKNGVDARFGGDQRGSTGVIGEPVEITKMGYSPSEMDARSLRRVPEERVTAIFGIAAVVVGMGAGLDRSTFANFAEAREAAVESNLLPTYRVFAETLVAQLLPDFDSNLDATEVFFDTSEIRELQPDQDKLTEREALKLRSGMITINEARSHTGDDPLEGGNGDVLLIPATSVPTPLDAIVPVAPPALAVPATEGEPTTAAYDPDAIESKALGVLRGIEALRARLQESETRAVQKMLEIQRDQVLGVIQTSLSASLRQSFDIYEVETKLINVSDVIDRLEAGWRDTIRTILHGLHLRAIESTYTVVGSGLDTTIDVDPRTRQRLLREAGANVRGINDTTLSALRNTIRASQRADESLEELTARIRGLAVFGDSRAETIARTELGIATNRASLAAYDASGIIKRVRIHDGTEHDAACASLAGRVVSLAEAQGLPSLGHPNCLVGETIVLAPNLQASFARWFEGEVVVLETAEHDLLTCTPNHPVLTPEGWIAAGELEQGDHVLRSGDSERISRLLDPDHDNRPTMIEEIARSLGPACGGATAIVPIAAVDFHGDGANSDVCVVRTNGRGEIDTPRALLSEQFGHLPIVGADARAGTLTADGIGYEPFLRDWLASDSGMSSGSIGPSSLRSEPGILQAVGFGGAATHTRVAEPISDSGRIDAQDGADLLGAQLLDDVQLSQTAKPGMLHGPATGTHGEPALAELTGDAGLTEASSLSKIMSSFAGLIAPVQLVKVERRQFAGHVYNLETEQGWYIASHIITHNCVRRFEAIVEPAHRSLGNGHVEHGELVGV